MSLFITWWSGRVPARLRCWNQCRLMIGEEIKPTLYVRAMNGLNRQTFAILIVVSAYLINALKYIRTTRIFIDHALSKRNLASQRRCITLFDVQLFIPLSISTASYVTSFWASFIMWRTFSVACVSSLLKSSVSNCIPSRV